MRFSHFFIARPIFRSALSTASVPSAREVAAMFSMALIPSRQAHRKDKCR